MHRHYTISLSQGTLQTTNWICPRLLLYTITGQATCKALYTHIMWYVCNCHLVKGLSKYILMEPLGANDKKLVWGWNSLWEKEVKTKSLVQNNTLVPLLQNLRSEDPRHQLAASSDAGNYCCSYKKLKFTLSRVISYVLPVAAFATRIKNGIKQSTSILLVQRP